MVSRTSRSWRPRVDRELTDQLNRGRSAPDSLLRLADMRGVRYRPGLFRRGPEASASRMVAKNMQVVLSAKVLAGTVGSPVVRAVHSFDASIRHSSRRAPKVAVGQPTAAMTMSFNVVA